jgi:hypothetical protein
MLTDSIKAAMRRAHYEILSEDGSFYISNCQSLIGDLLA